MAHTTGNSGNPRDNTIGDPDVQDNLTDSSSDEDELPLRPGEEHRLQRILAQQESLRLELTAQLAEAELDEHFHKLRSLHPGADYLRRADRPCTAAEARDVMRSLDDILTGIVHALGVPVAKDAIIGFVPETENAAVGVPVCECPLIMPQGIPVHLLYPQFASTEGVTPANPLVQVLRDPERKLKVKIACFNRKGLLADLLEAIRSVNLTTKEGLYVRLDPHMLVDVELEKGHPSMEPIDEASTSEPRQHPPPPIENEEDDRLRELLLSVIRRDPGDPDKKGDSNGKGDV